MSTACGLPHFSCEPDSQAKKEPVGPGLAAATKNLYRRDGGSHWKELAPEAIGVNSKSTSHSQEYALTVRREQVQNDEGEPSLRLHSITVQSPLIKQKLRSFEFQLSNEQDSESAEHYKLLHDVVRSEIKPHIDHTKDLLNNGVISYDYVWALFHPGTEIHSKDDDDDRLYLLTSGNYTQTLALSCRYICTNGRRFGYKTASLSIDAFENVKPVSELNVLPLRGRKYERLRGINFMSYSGAYNLRDKIYNRTTRQILEEGSRVIIDRASYLMNASEQTGNLSPLEGPAPTSYHVDDHEDLASGDAPPLQAVRLAQYMARQTRRKHATYDLESTDNTRLSEKHYALCDPIVKGFCMKAKGWASFRVDLVDDIKWNGDIFQHLVLPEDFKRIVWAFVDSHLSRTDDFDDIVKGKGTSHFHHLRYAHVAETMKKPLYSISAGELGGAAGEVETNLGRVLELSAKWDAVLLIDECDIFLEQRTTSDLQRNKIVSVFLRLLEYYHGVLFLTTNRVASFDPAFESRIHLTINYPELNVDSRLQIWKTFVKPESGSNAVQKAELQMLSRIKLNGRQIKNVVKTARLLASREEKALTLEHLEVVLRVKNCLPADSDMVVD
ncbi:P-loop containing nucleoside triphosphate hydrolase protein [Xylariaceae sp. FL1272]|nr:P-loop containing nucleoside triphosphate hydrolase protein [Xylariaceae sp. FL1272]